MKRMSRHLILSITFFLSSLALYSLVAPSFAPPQIETVRTVEVPRTPETVAAPCTFEVEGVWEQYSIEADGQRVFMARLEIRRDGVHYLAHPISIAEFVFPKHTYRSYDHQYREGVWTFREDWGHGEVGEFALEQNSYGEFVGTARHAGCAASFDTMFIRVGD